MKKTFSGPSRGVGAAYAWDGNNDIGAEFVRGLAGLKALVEKK